MIQQNGQPARIGTFLWQALPEGSEKYQAYLCSREWAERRNAVYKRCGSICERCNMNAANHVHHLTYARKYAELPEDLQALCRGCHEFTHGKSDVDPAKQRQEELRLPKPLKLGARQEYGGSLMVCPYCGCANCHMEGPPTWMEGDQGFATFHMSCEGRCKWEMVFEGHEGWLTAYTQNWKERNEP